METQVGIWFFAAKFDGLLKFLQTGRRSRNFARIPYNISNTGILQSPTDRPTSLHPSYITVSTIIRDPVVFYA